MSQRLARQRRHTPAIARQATPQKKKSPRRPKERGLSVLERGDRRFS